MHGPAEGVRTEGLLYPLHGETLTIGTTRGVSNVLVAAEALVELTAGVALVVRPLSVPSSIPTVDIPQIDHPEPGA